MSGVRSTTFPIPGLAAIATFLGLKPASPGRWSMPARVEPTLAPESPRSARIEKLLAAARTQPDLQMIEWPGETTAAAEVAAPREDVRTLDTRRRKMRDRYIAARFPGVAHCGADLADSATVIEAARYWFEDARPALAFELLALAIEEAPQDPAPALARIEFRFLLRDADGFVEAARAFRAAHPKHEAWDEVCRLGRAIAPQETLFGSPGAARAHEHYGPWPHLPNWIQAPWDLTAEVCAADFHRALANL
jgi:hypothetical protein